MCYTNRRLLYLLTYLLRAVFLVRPVDAPVRSRSGRTWTAVELVGLRDVSGTEFDALSDLWSDGRVWVAAGSDRVQVGGSGERVASVVHDTVEVVRFAERVHLGRRQRVEVVLLPCNHQPRHSIIIIIITNVCLELTSCICCHK